MSKPRFQPVTPNVNFPEMEKRILEWWYKNGIVDTYLHRNDNSKKLFSFLDGPITANNPMGVHHAWGRTYKDVWQRFMNMRGYKQRFQNGFDCQGLWIEVEVEKELGIKNKRDIENLVPGDRKASIAKFVELCKERVKKYSAIQTEQSKRLGYFMDWDHSYFTMSEENNYMIWHFLKKCHDHGYIYKGHDVVPWCPRCETAISQHEMLTEDYKEITHDTIYIEYPIFGKPHTYLLAWTTTPWTLPGNVAVAVDRDKEYVEAQAEGAGNTYILIAEAAKRLNLAVRKTIRGKDLVGLRYSSPFDDLPRVKKAFGTYTHRVVASDALILPVTTEEGTGMVHVAPGQGTEDYQLGKKEKLPVIELIDDEAVYLGGLNEFSGQNAKKHPEIIVDFLRKTTTLFKTERYTHRYPACWRCKTELVWKVTDEWYIAMYRPSSASRRTSDGKSVKPLRQQMMDVAKKITWIPEFGKERELDWLANMHDWLISKKNRYWGLALPIYECASCGWFTVIGSKEELKSKAVSGWERFEGHTPHKPWVDEVKILCGRCKKEVERIADVGNPWLDAGIVPFSTLTRQNQGEPLYLTDKKEFSRWFPVKFITESFPGQFKNWFYSLIAMSTVLENTNPFETVLGFGTLLGEDGRPMHKSWGNAVEFNEGADKIGVDVMRWMYARHNPAENLLFGYKSADETRRKFHILLWNVYNFFVTYANVDTWQPGTETKKGKSKASVLDLWILSKLHGLISLVTSSLEHYDAATASSAVEVFVTDLSQWYVRRSRDRVGPAATNEASKHAFYETTYEVLTVLCRLLAPFTPFLADEIYMNLTGEESVHLSDWPEGGETDTALEKAMEDGRMVASVLSAFRKQANVKVRIPFKKLNYRGPRELQEDIKRIVLAEANVYELVYEGISEPDKEYYAAGGQFDVANQDVQAGKARELVRQIQMLRKEKGCTIDEHISVSLPKEYQSLSKKILDYIKTETLAKELTWGDALNISTG